MRTAAKQINGKMAAKTVPVRAGEITNMSTITIMMKRVPLRNIEIFVPRVS